MSAVFLVTPIQGAVASYFFGELLTLSPDAGFHKYLELSEMVQIGMLIGVTQAAVCQKFVMRFMPTTNESSSESREKWLLSGLLISAIAVLVVGLLFTFYGLIREFQSLMAFVFYAGISFIWMGPIVLITFVGAVTGLFAGKAVSGC